MYKIATLTAIAIVLGTALPAYAEAPFLQSNSGSSANALAGAQSAAQAISSSQGGQGGNVNITSNVPASTRSEIVTSGTQTIKSAPQVVAPSMSSGHPCAYAPISVGISVIGFGGAFGGQRIDDACLLAQMGVAPAAVLMIAARNPAACRALMQVGRVSSCGGRSAQTAAAPVRYQRKTVAAKPVGYAQPVAKTATYASLKKGQLYRKVPGGKLYRKG